MTTATPAIIETFEEFAKPLIESGRYRSADDVILSKERRDANS